MKGVQQIRDLVEDIIRLRKIPIECLEGNIVKGNGVSLERGIIANPSFARPSHEVSIVSTRGLPVANAHRWHAVWLHVWTRHCRCYIHAQNCRCACAGNAGNVFPSPQVSDPHMHYGTCVTHVPWCMPGSLTNGFLWKRRRGKTFPAFPAHVQPAILHIW